MHSWLTAQYRDVCHDIAIQRKNDPFQFTNKPGTIIRVQRIVFEQAYKFRAEVHRTVGYAICTPLSLMILNALLKNKLGLIFNLTNSLAFLMFIVGVLSVTHGLTIMTKLDEVKYRYELKNKRYS